MAHNFLGHQTVTELQAFLTDKDEITSTSDAQLADYQLVDFRNVGDMEISPTMSWLKQAFAAPGHEHHH